VKDQHVVTRGPQPAQRAHDRVGVHEQIGHQQHHPAPGDETGGLLESSREVGGMAARLLGERGDQPSPLSGPRTRRDTRPDRVIEADESNGVALPEQQQAKGRHQLFAVAPFREQPRGRPPFHRPAHVEDERGPQIGLFLVLLHHPAVGACSDLPVHVSQVVAWLIGTKIGELHRKPLAG
jgi:hypothetical protein